MAEAKPDFVIFDRQRKAEKDYWLSRLTDGPAATALPADFERPAGPAMESASIRLEVRGETLERLRKLAKTPFLLYTTLTAALAAALQKQTRTSQIVLGTAALREESGEEGAPNALVIALEVDEARPFRELLLQVRQTLLDAHAHQRYPFERLVRDLQLQSAGNRCPLFDIALRVDGLHGDLPNAGNDLTFHFRDEAGRITGRLDFRPDLFRFETVEHLGQMLLRLLDSGLREPTAPIAGLRLLSEEEEETILRRWNDTAAEVSPVLVHHRVEEWAQRTPEAVAVSAPGERLTWGELNRRANRLAHHLRSRGAGPETRIAVCIERSPELIVALLGVLKAGGTYVPFDPKYPRERIALLLEDTAAPVLLTRRWLLDSLPAGVNERALCIDGDLAGLSGAAGTDPEPSGVDADHLAYMIYTSGSTGRPKGVQIAHAGLANLVSWHQRTYGITAADRASLVAGTAFDASVWEIWPYLTAGASLAVPGDETRAHPATLAGWLAGERVTCCFLPTPLAEAMLESMRDPVQGGWPAGLALRVLLVGGDKLHRPPLEELPFALVNHYGPTESSVVSTCTPVAAGRQGDPAPPIGRPIANTRVYIVDPELHPVPVGMPGELLVGGVGLSRGYHERPGLTAERFIPDPFAAEPGGRLYRTGDLVRSRQDGQIEFLGRTDFQVKVRGYRIELGEIEAALHQHPAVGKALVVSREDDPGQRRLVAYVVQDATYQGEGVQGSDQAGEWSSEQVSQWQTLYDQTYGQTAAENDAAFNIVGWNSSYTGQPIQADEMRLWVEETVEQVLSAKPRSVLEIGCGTGLLLFRIAPHCERYAGTDFSQVALSQIERELERRRQAGEPVQGVSLSQRLADDFSGLEGELFDAVVINSVVQYFPSVDYLRQVLAGAVERVRPGGFIFAGDVRSLPLLAAFHASVELYKAPNWLTRPELAEIVRRHLANEEELTLAPGFFLALGDQLPQVARVEVFPKQGRYRNELSRFRYQVLIHVGPASERTAMDWLDWRSEGMTLETLRRRLESEMPDAVAFSRVPNLALLSEVRTAELLAVPEGTETARELRKAVQIEEATAETAVDITALHALGKQLSYRVDVSWAAGRADGSLDILLRRHGSEAEAAVPAFPGEGASPRAWHEYGNNPLRERLARTLAPELRTFLAGRLPEYMVPSAIVLLDAFPLTPNGKIDRRALPAPEGQRLETGAAYVPPRNEIERIVSEVWKETLRLETVGIRDNFFDLGGHSLLMVQVHSKLRNLFKRDLSMIEMFRYSTIESLAEYLSESEGVSAEAAGPAEEAAAAAEAPREQPAPAPAARPESRDIAVIGMTGRFPGAPGLDAFWRNLRDAVESVSFFSDEELKAAGVDPALAAHPDYVRAGTVLNGVEEFDALFFGYSAREAQVMDPQQRLFLEAAWEALENAGYDPESYEGRRGIGVFAGAGINTYLLNNLLSNPALIQTVGGFQTILGNGGDLLTTRISYKLNLKGPSVNIQTGCSTSLVAIHMACQSLLAGECDMALAGGVAIPVPQTEGYLYTQGGVVAPDGHCRAFDARAEGCIPGKGLGIVVLKRLADALAGGDTIRAVIKGSAINNDGSAKAGYTAPSIDGQAEVIGRALDAAGVEAESIGYIEAHGTATPIGDPIEVAALNAAFRARTKKQGFCLLGSVKTNIGHLDVAAGVAGFIKTVLALEHGDLPPSLNFQSPNPKIDLDASPFRVNAWLRPWHRSESAPRRAGVSSFGIGGTNAHVILEEAPPAPETGEARPWQLLVLSARTEAALESATDNLAAHLRRHPELSLADAAYTLQAGRKAFPHRRVLVCAGAEEAAEALESRDPERLATAAAPGGYRPVVFLFPGQGAQYAGMGAELYRTEPTFRRELDRCAELLEPQLGMDLRTVIHPEDPGSPEAGDRLRQTLFAQPALFAVEHALARLWMEWGIRPAAMLGHSLGEYVAACLAGVFSLEEALGLVAERAKLMHGLPPGSMLAVSLPEDEVRARIADGEDLSLAAVNAPGLVVVSGPSPAVEALEARLRAEGIEHRPLHTSHAFHSSIVEPILDRFGDKVRSIRLRAPEIPVISNVTGRTLTAAEATDPEYWVRHLRQTVRFADGLEEILRQTGAVLIEAGPGRTLGTLAGRHPRKAAGHLVLPTLRHPQDAVSDGPFLLRSLGRLWLAGVKVDWAGFHAHERRRRVPLPTYAFERRRYWIEPGPGLWAAAPAQGSLASGHPGPEPRSEESRREEIAAGLRPDLPNPYVAPRTPLERAVGEVWREFFGFDRIGVHDDFFDLGGHSLMATQLASRVREVFAVDLPVEGVFESPTVAGMALRIEAGRATRSEAVESGAAAPSLRRVPREDDLEVSFAQQRLWFLDQLEPGSSVYNLPVALRLSGPLDVEVLARSLGEIVHRHEALRTTFAVVDGRPVQVIAPKLDLPLPVESLEGLGEPEREAAAVRRAVEEVQKPFDLAHGPLVRALLLRLGADEHVLLLTLHHIISDGWSLGVLLSEMGALYEAFSRGGASPLPELPVQYADFAAWQREWLQGSALQEQVSYWLDHLAGAPVLLELPADRPRPKLQTYRGGTLTFSLPAALSSAVRAIAHRQQGETLFMVLLAAFKTLLYRYTGQTDLVVGTVIANRTRQELEGLIGFFVNTLALRTGLDGDPAFRELLSRVRQVALGAYAHQDLPFEKLVEELQPQRSLSHSPVFQVLFELQNTPPGSSAALPGLRLAPLEVERGTVAFDLIAGMTEIGDRLQGAIEYNAGLFDLATVERLRRHFETLLEGVAADPGRSLADLSLLAPGEREQLLVAWNPAPSPLPERCLHQLFETQAAATPDAIAVVADPAIREGRRGLDRLDYRSLNALSNRLARHLQTLGVGPEVRVGLAVERSCEMLVAVLGVLKAGGTYVPLDPGHPADRLHFMAEDAGIRVLLTTADLALPFAAPEVVRLDADWTSIARHDASDLPDAGLPGSAAYVLYTSGSTGRPKGVQITHRAAVNFLLSMRANPGLTARDTVLAVTTLSFDIALLELFLPLLVGERVELASRATAGDGARLIRRLEESGATVLQATPATWRLLLESGWKGNRALRLFSAGETLPREIAERLLPLSSSLWNLYGPTETTVFSAIHEVESGPGLVPLGRPIANTRIYVVDPRLAPMPAGVPGELLIGGAGVARGYLGRPDLTAERFVPDPFGAEPGGRLYRTGDLARHRSDGTVEFLGRLDHQIKVRGFRIEPAEIEAALAGHPGVRQAVVVAVPDAQGARLAAWLVAGSDPAPAPAELRAFLALRLPDYMVPATWGFLESLPLTPNGKIDRKALAGRPASEAGRPDHIAPRTPEEALLAQIWTGLLPVERVGAGDNFFDLGGHSLLVARLVARVREAFEVDLPVRVVLEAPTVEALARRVSELRATGGLLPLAEPDLEAEVVLDPEVRVELEQPAIRTAEPRHVFLTGASGFVGSFLLHELLTRTNADVHCLVRAADEAAGAARLRRRLEEAQLWDEAFAPRILPVVGDLSEPRLGLSPERFDELAERVDAVFHNGAWVNFLYPYPALKPANVLGTQEALRLAVHRRVKPFHYISTTSVLKADGRGVFREDELYPGEGLPNGYAQSKWVAERLVEIARTRGVPAAIYRLGRVTGHSRTAVSNPEDFLFRMIKSCIELGSAPEIDLRGDMTPVDFVARAIVHLSLRPESPGKNFHLVNPDLVPWSSILDSMRSYGYEIRPMPAEEWHSTLVAQAGDGAGHSLSPLVSLLTPALGENGDSSTPRFDCGNVVAGLAGSSITCPPVDRELLTSYVRYFIRTGQLAPPPGQETA